MNPIILELLIEEPIKLSPEGQQAVISAYDIAVKNGFVGTELEWLQTVQNIQSPITAEVLAAAQAAAASALAAGASEQVALEKAAEMIQLAQAVLALRNQAESAASASGSFATASGEFATDSNSAKALSEAAKVIAIEEAGKSGTSAGQSAGSAAAAEAASALIVNKAQINLTTLGRILRANGTLFESISEVEFLRNINAYQRAPDSKFFDNKQLIAWDNFNRINTNPILINDAGQSYSLWRGTTRGQVLSNSFIGNAKQESTSIFTIPNTKNLGIEFSMMRSTLGGQITGIAIVKNDTNYLLFGRFFRSAAVPGSGDVFTEIPTNTEYNLFSVVNGVATILGSISAGAMYSGGANLDSFLGSRLIFVIKYANRGRNGNSSLVVQSLDNPALRIDVNITNLNTTFVTPSDYNRIAIITNDEGKIHSYKIANIDL